MSASSNAIRAGAMAKRFSASSAGPASTTCRAWPTCAKSASRARGASRRRRSSSPSSTACRSRFLPRHGRGHRLSPTHINYRANIDALKRAGVTDLVSVSAVGSLREDLPPGTFVLVDQFIDRTFAREKSFFGKGMVAHVSMAHPVARCLRERIGEAGEAENIAGQRGGTYVVHGGPAILDARRERPYWCCGMR